MMRLLVGCFLGILTVLSPGLVFMGFLMTAVGCLLYRYTDFQDRRFLTGLFIAGFALRVLLSLGLDLGSWAVEREVPFWKGDAQGWNLGISDKTRSYLRMGDSDYYSARGWALAEYIRGSREPVVLFRINQYGWNGYADLIGFFYTLFGFSPSAVKGVNLLLGAGCGTLTFFLALWGFNRKVARWAAVGVTFFPSLVCWSVSNLKDIPFIFLTLLAILFFIRLMKTPGIPRRLLSGLLFVLTLMLHSSVREVFVWVLIASLLAATVLSRWRIRPRTLALAAGIGVGLLYWNPVAQPFRAVLGQLFRKHIGYITTPGISYHLFPPIFYTYNYLWKWIESGSVDRTILTAILKAPSHFFLEPLPWRLDTWMHLPVLFQMILWYGMLPFGLLGTVASIRHGAGKALILLFPFFSFSLLMALTSGNVGTLFRIRDLITPFLLIFAFVGLEGFLKPNVVQRSRLAACGASASQQLLTWVWNWTGGLRQSGMRFTRGFQTAFVKDAALVLLTAVLVNSFLLTFRETEWTGWNVGFRIGVLSLSLWGMTVSSDWVHLQERSLLVRLYRKGGIAEPCQTHR